MSSKIAFDAQGQFSVQAGLLTDVAVAFTQRYAQKGRSAHEIICLALMEGMRLGFEAGLEESKQLDELREMMDL